MKQLLFLLLFPCLALAQYTGNAGQKITLGEQTSADGLVYRGVANDTNVITPFSDTSAYIILDTVNSKFYHYNRTTTYWALAGGDVTSFSAGTTGLTPTTATTGAVTLGGTLAVANGGTGQSTLAAAGINTGSGTLNYLPKYTATGTTLGNSIIFDNGSNVGIGADGSAGYKFDVNGTGRFSSTVNIVANASAQNLLMQGRDLDNYGQILFYSNDGLTRYGYLQSGSTDGGTIAIAGDGGGRIDLDSRGFYVTTGAATFNSSVTAIGNVGIGTTPAVQLHTTGAVRFAGLASITDLRTDADGDLFNGSDFNLKNSIDTINFGLSDVLKLKPVSFNWNDEARNINEYKSMGFIAQDIMDVIPNAASTMGDGDMQVDYNAIVATLTKAIQEQQALIKALEQRILTLENK